jgi:hypothetical protein
MEWRNVVVMRTENFFLQKYAKNKNRKLISLWLNFSLKLGFSNFFSSTVLRHCRMSRRPKSPAKVAGPSHWPKSLAKVAKSRSKSPAEVAGRSRQPKSPAEVACQSHKVAAKSRAEVAGQSRRPKSPAQVAGQSRWPKSQSHGQIAG